jgi:cation diffusion facilitator CzcD-associated flavoprotein CzcO
MSATHTSSVQAGPKAEHFDVLIVGAGISGIGGAYHLTQ